MKYNELLRAYEAIHRNRLNRLSHVIGIPMIMASILGLTSLASISLSGDVAGFQINLAWVVALSTTAITLSWSWKAAAAYMPSLILAVTVYLVLGSRMGIGTSTMVFGAMFVVGWIIQFIGHAFEGQSPEFVSRPANLLLGPISVGLELIPALRPYSYVR